MSVNTHHQGSTVAASRRQVLRGFLAVSGLALATPALQACSAGAGGGPQRVKVTQAVSSLAYAQNYVALRTGLYKKRDLAVETIVTDGGGPDVQAVLTNSAEFTFNDGCQVMTALSDDRRLVAVAAAFDRPLVNATISQKAAAKLGLDASTPVSDRLAALKGLRIGVTAPGALTWQLARFDLAGAGYDPDKDAKLVALGGGPAVQAALENDQVDVIYISVPFGEAAVARGTGMTLVNNAMGENPALPSFMMEGLWASPETIESEPELVQAMVDATVEASEFLSSSEPAEIAKVLRPDFSGFDEGTLLAAVEMLQSAVSTDGRWSGDAAANTWGVLEANGLANPDTPDIETVFDESFLA